ncbi:MAG: hypothetical protein NVSMB65_10620 [Chloroflexota bacterium]
MWRKQPREQDEEPAGDRPSIELARAGSPDPVVTTGPRGYVSALRDALTVPALDPLLYIEPRVKRQMEAIYRLSRRHPVKVLMVGPQGCGKTEMARWLAATHDLPWLKVNCPAIQDPRDWFGWMTVRDGETVYQPTAVAEAIERGNCIVFFDELNRLHTALWGPLYGLLDDTNQVWVDQLGRHLHLRSGTIVIAAMNEGSQNIGVFLQDAALMERFVRIEATFLPPEREAEMLTKRTGIAASMARALVEVATLARRQAVGDDASLPWQVSTRSLIRTAELVDAGLPPHEAFEMTVTLRLPTEGALSSPRAEFLRIIQAKLG